MGGIKMSSCSVDETKDRVVVKYLNGQSYEYKGYAVDCFVDWKNNILNLVKTEHIDEHSCNDIVGFHNAFLTSDTMVVESWHSDSVTIWKNPKYKLSVKTDVMTAKQRAKKNQDKKNKTQRLIEVHYEGRQKKMSKLEVVESRKCTDGKVFVNLEEATKHQACVDFDEKYYDNRSMYVDRHGTVDPDELRYWLFKQYDLVQQLYKVMELK